MTQAGGGQGVDRMARTTGGGRGGKASRRDIIREAARRPARALRRAADAVRRSSGPAPVFVSYGRDDIAVAGALVDHLRAHAVTVAWDQDLDAGTDYEQALRRTILAAPAVVVVWSATSVLSPFVRDEARLALEAGKLITTHVAGFEYRSVPFGFGHLHLVPVDDRERLAKALAGYGVILARDGARIAAP